MKLPLLYTLFLIFICFNDVNGLKILGIFPMYAHSHFTIGLSLMKELAERGHQVTFINSLMRNSSTTVKNLKDVSVTGISEPLLKMKEELYDLENMNYLRELSFYYRMGNVITESTFAAPEVQQLIKSDEHFDAVVAEEFLAPALMAFANVFKAPLVLVSAMPSSGWNNDLFGNPAPLSYIATITSKLPSKMNFFQRIKNAYCDTLDKIYRHLIFYPQQNVILHKYFPNAPHLDEIMYNASLILLNSHVSVNDPVPHVPNMIEIGGYHVQPPKELPKDLKDYLDNAKEGVVYFSMGSNLKSADLPVHTRDAILKSFSKIKQKVLWKFEADNLPGQTPSVKIQKWMPQSDILAHRNTKAFISHGGLLGTIEAVYYGVPVVGIPVFGDQKNNILAAVNNGYAVSIPLDSLTEEALSNALEEILHNPKYTENVKKRSRIMHDQPVNPKDAAVYWIEYVVRHQGATYFRSAALDLSWYQRSMLDVIIFLTICTVVLFILFYIIIRKIIGPKPNRLDTKKKII